MGGPKKFNPKEKKKNKPEINNERAHTGAAVQHNPEPTTHEQFVRMEINM